MSQQTSGPPSDANSPDSNEEARQAERVCWWCQQRPATTREHKFKRTDLMQLKGDRTHLVKPMEDGSLLKLREFRRDKRQAVTFSKSMCAPCNNMRSQGMDRAYETYSSHIFERWGTLPRAMSLSDIYGTEWRSQSVLLAQYFVKHFACRMVDLAIDVPSSMIRFLDEAVPMPDVDMTMVTTDSVTAAYGEALYVGLDGLRTAGDSPRLIEYVSAYYIGPMGVRFQWIEEGLPPGFRGSFFTQEEPVLVRFRDEECMAHGVPMGAYSYVPVSKG